MSLLLQGVKVMLRITLRGPLAVDEESLNQDKPHPFKSGERSLTPHPSAFGCHSRRLQSKLAEATCCRALTLEKAN